MAGSLHVPEHHDLDEAPDMQRIGGRVEPDVTGDSTGSGSAVQRVDVSALVDESALEERAQELRAR